MTDTQFVSHINRALLHTDGASRGNPGISGVGFIVSSHDDREPKTLCSGGAYIGIATNNQAEYQALIWGLRNAIDLGVQILDIYADSELVIKQLIGVYKVKNEGIKPLFAEACALLENFDHYTLTHVERESNAVADALANEAMDKRSHVGTFRVPYISGELFSSVELEQASDETEQDAPPLVQNDTKSWEDLYTLTVKDHFDAAHALVGYPGECKDLHGHTWDIEVSVCGTRLDEVGILYDFKDIKRDLKNILDAFDHTYLNEVSPFDTMNATAENLARVIYEQLEARLPKHVSVKEVAVWESPVARLAYTRKY